MKLLACEAPDSLAREQSEKKPVAHEVERLEAESSRASSRPEPLVRQFSRDAVPGYARFICPCEFDLGKDQDGETVLIIDHNSEGQPAFVNLDGSIVRLQGDRAFRFQCEPSETVQASWKADGIDLHVGLTTTGPGEEACFFRGELTVAKGDRREVRPIVGGCGC